MILNEDYFKDLEITDEDITVNDNIDFIDIDSIYRTAESEYEQTIQLRFKEKDIDRYIHEHGDSVFTNMSRRITMLFDLYDIKHSQVYLTSGVSGCKNSSSITYAQHDGYIRIVNDGYNQNELSYNTHIIVIYITRPVFSNIKRMFNFTQTLINILFLHDRPSIFGQISIMNGIVPFTEYDVFMHYRNLQLSWNAAAWFDSVIKNTKKYKQPCITKPLYLSIVYDLIGWFFGKQTYSNFKSKWQKDKLDYTIFPDDKPCYCIVR